MSRDSLAEVPGQVARAARVIEGAFEAVAVPSDPTPRIREEHISVIHAICVLVEDEFS